MKPPWQVWQATLLRQTEHPKLTNWHGRQLISPPAATRKKFPAQVVHSVGLVQVVQLEGQATQSMFMLRYWPMGQFWAVRRTARVARTRSCHLEDMIISLISNKQVIKQ